MMHGASRAGHAVMHRASRVSHAVMHSASPSDNDPKPFPVSRRLGTMSAMTGSDTTKIDPAALGNAAASGGKTTVSSVPVVMTPPTPITAGSPIDLAAVAAAVASEGLVQAHATADNAASVKQMEALAESPPVLVAQDQQGAQEITTSAGGIPVFPMPAAGGGLTGVKSA